MKSRDAYYCDYHAENRKKYRRPAPRPPVQEELVWSGEIRSLAKDTARRVLSDIVTLAIADNVGKDFSPRQAAANVIAALKEAGVLGMRPLEEAAAERIQRQQRGE